MVDSWQHVALVPIGISENKVVPCTSKRCQLASYRLSFEVGDEISRSSAYLQELAFQQC